MHDLIRDIALGTAAAWLLGVAAQLLRQPVILAYLAAGFLLGPSALGWIHDQESIATISELGLIFLLFMIGLEIDLKKIISAGRSITVTALVQILGGSLLGVLFFRVLGFQLGGPKGWDALYLGIAAALSSTVIIVKVLYDKRELDTLPGRITLGVLVLQDLFVILFLAVQPNLNDLKVQVLGGSLFRVLVLVGSSLVASRYLLPHIFQRVARLPELVLVGAIGWCFLVGEVAHLLGLSREMGALVAGVALSTFPYALDVTAKVTSLRDFFVTLFFVGLGMKIQRPDPAIAGWAAILAVFVIGSRFATVFPPLHLLRQGLRGSLLPAINLCQISEFSLVLMELGSAERFLHVSPLARDMTSLAFVGLAALSSFGMVRSDPLVRRWIPFLRRAGLRDLDDSPSASAGGEEGHHGGRKILLLGFFRSASSLLDSVTRHAPELLPDLGVVDFNPEVHAALKQRGIHVVYGDLAQRETLVHAGVASAEVLVCTIPDSLLKGTTNQRLVRTLRELNPDARIIAPAEVIADAVGLLAAGADYVSIPRVHEGDDLCAAVRAAVRGLLPEKRAELITRLRGRDEILP